VRLTGLVVCVCLGIASLVTQAQSPPNEFVTFLSHGREISCAVYGPREPMGTIIVLEGKTPLESNDGPAQAAFFAAHGYRVLLPDYTSVATPTSKPTAANYRRWAQVVEDMLLDPDLLRSRKVGIAGQNLGASVALVAAANNSRVSVVVEWSGLLPNEFFSQVQTLPPLLILHGEQDEEVPVVNARQLVRLCKLKDFVCEAPEYPNEGHVFSASAVESSNLRALNFYRTYLR
jgi:dipeptidyl aminopeptidase/acylaminoacyl peptidase